MILSSVIHDMYTDILFFVLEVETVKLFYVGLTKGGLILWSHDAYEHVCVCLSQDSARACVYDCFRLVT